MADIGASVLETMLDTIRVFLTEPMKLALER